MDIGGSGIQGQSLGSKFKVSQNYIKSTVKTTITETRIGKRQDVLLGQSPEIKQYICLTEDGEMERKEDRSVSSSPGNSLKSCVPP